MKIKILLKKVKFHMFIVNLYCSAYECIKGKICVFTLLWVDSAWNLHVHQSYFKLARFFIPQPPEGRAYWYTDHWYINLQMTCNHLWSFVFQGYYGCATGKAKQAAKTEIEKLKVSRTKHIQAFDSFGDNKRLKQKSRSQRSVQPTYSSMWQFGC